MKNLRIKGILTAMTVFVMMFSFMVVVHAASGSVTFGSSSYTVTEGEEFNIGVYVKSDVNVAAYTFNIEYDSTKMEYVSGADAGGSGKLSFAGYPNSDYKKYWLTFKATASGDCTLKVTNVYLGPTDASLGDSLTVSKTGNAPITIKASGGSGSETGSAGAADLKSIWIAETGFYGFSANKTQYDITVDSDMEKVTVTAEAADPNAAVTISDTNLKVGTNYVYINVTGQDGSTKKYTVIIRRKQPSSTTETTTPAEQPSEEETTTPAEDETTGGNTDAPAVDTTTSLYSYNDVPLYFCSGFEGVEIPEGYEQVSMTISDYKVDALADATASNVLFYMADANGDNASLYVYKIAKNMVYPYVELKSADRVFVIDESTEPKVPDGYQKVDLLISGVGSNGKASTAAWYHADAPEFYLIYASCDGGESALYQYDVKENTIQRYNAMSAELGATGNVDADEVSELKEEIEELKEQNKSSTKKWLVLVIILAILCALLVAGIVVIFNKYRENMEYAEYDEEEEYYDEFEDDEYDAEGTSEESVFKYERLTTPTINEQNDEEIDDNDFTFL